MVGVPIFEQQNWSGCAQQRSCLRENRRENSHSGGDFVIYSQIHEGAGKVSNISLNRANLRRSLRKNSSARQRMPWSQCRQISRTPSVRYALYSHGIVPLFFLISRKSECRESSAKWERLTTLHLELFWVAGNSLAPFEMRNSTLQLERELEPMSNLQTIITKEQLFTRTKHTQTCTTMYTSGYSGSSKTSRFERVTNYQRTNGGGNRVQCAEWGSRSQEVRHFFPKSTYSADSRCILVFDLGGGTFDVTIVEIEGWKPPRVLATGGSTELGFWRANLRASYIWLLRLG